MSETTGASTRGDGHPRAVLLDRDGTIIEERGYLSGPGDVRLLPRAAGAIREFREAGLQVLVLSNQSAVARGIVDRPGLDGIHARLEALLAAEGAAVDGIYFCPHMPGAGCACRKPRSGLVEAAARDLGFAPGESFVVGDQDCDVELARNIGATSILVLTGHGASTVAAGTATPDYTVSDLAEAAQVILGRTGREATRA